MQLDDELYTSLIDVALVGARNGFAREANRIFDSLVLQSPKDMRAPIAKAISHIHMNRANEAVTILREQVLKGRPEHAFARGFLGFALKMSGKKREGDSVLEALIADAPDPTAVEFAQSLLEDPAFDAIESVEEEPDEAHFLPGGMLQPAMFC